MDSFKAVTKFETICTGDLEWEIQDLSLHFEDCNYTREGKNRKLEMYSPELQIPAGADGKRHSKWHFGLLSLSNVYKSVKFFLNFNGLFGSDGAEIKEPFRFKYNAVIEKSLEDVAEIIQTEGNGLNGNVNRSIDFERIHMQELESVWPHGNLKISVQISQLSDVKNEVSSSLCLDLMELKNALPVSSCYGNLMNNPDLSDFKILCEGTTFHAHKLILSVHSRVFRAMIESGLSESSQNELEIKDMTIETVKLMLEFIYKGTVEDFPEDLEENIQLLDCAEKYELEGLKSICMTNLFTNQIKEENVGELAMVAFTYGAHEKITKAIKDLCIKNHEQLIQNPEYKKLFLANPQAFMN